MDVPESMRAELAAWNNGGGIDLESWVGCEDNFRLAIGYAAIFWPAFVEFDRYLLRAGFSVEALRGFEAEPDIDRRSVETVMNHLHIADIQYCGAPDLTPDKALLLCVILKEIYEAKLQWQFPSRPCRVSIHVPEDPSATSEYEVSFWQGALEAPPA